MSRLDELIAELCPNGVEYKSIGEISTDIYRGSSITRDQVTKEGTPCVRYGEIYTTYGVWFDQCVSHTNVSKISNAKYFEHGDILFAITGESVEDIAKSCAYVGYEKCLAGGDIVVLKHKEDPKYLAYALTTTNARNQKSKGKVKSKVVHSSVPAIKEIIVPVPPLEVQREIVRVLDNFTFLSAKLSAELSARRKQYEYYRNQLLSFGSSTSQRRLEEICSIITDGSHWSPQEASEGFYMASVKDMRPNGFNYSSCKKIKKEDFDSLLKNGCRPEKGDVLVAKDGATMLKHAFVADGKEDLVVLSSIAILRPKQELINPSYLAHYFRQESFKERVIRTYSTVGGVPRIILKGFKKMEITVPPLEVQNRLVSVLDNFEAICSNLNIGLPAEIEARQKQYEYYRDLLLTFAETGNTLVTDGRTDGRTARQAEIALLQYVFGYVVLPLGDTCNMKAGKAIQAVELAEERDSDHPYLCYGGNGIRGYIGKTNYSGDYPIVGRQGALCGNVQYAEGDFYATEHAVVVTSKGLYKQRYLYYLLTAMNLNQYKSAGAQPGLAVGRIETISAPVPTLEKQEEIVRILDKFDRLCNDLSSGLPAEIVARQKQYVYYRDKLLTFQQIS